MVLTIGGALAIGSAALAAKPIWDGYKWVFPSAADIEQKAGSLTVGDDGLVQVTPEFAGYYGRSSVDTDTGKSAQQYVQDLYNNRIRKQEEFDWNSKPQVEARRLAAEKYRDKQQQYRDSLGQQQFNNDMLRLQMTDQRLQSERDADYRNEASLRGDQNALFALQTQRAQAKDRHALAIAELMNNKDKSAWEQNMYQQQLEYDREDRIRDQRKFYALLGQSILSEGVKAFF
jgi:hypothetical protein